MYFIRVFIITSIEVYSIFWCLILVGSWLVIAKELSLQLFLWFVLPMFLLIWFLRFGFNRCILFLVFYNRTLIHISIWSFILRAFLFMFFYHILVGLTSLSLNLSIFLELWFLIFRFDVIWNGFICVLWGGMFWVWCFLDFCDLPSLDSIFFVYLLLL